jgi:eukaryotic-like serine/threonine-protein kinase
LTLAGRYHVQRLLRRSETAEVSVARFADESGGEREVALKRLLVASAREESARAQFFDEARIASRFRHASLVAILDWGVLEDRPFIAMELVEGWDLERLLGGEAGSLHPRLLEVALAIGAAVARALAHAHASKDRVAFVHRRVAPENILVSWTGEVKLADLAGLSIVDAGYRAPEEQQSGSVDGRADVFSLGSVLHRMLVGRTPDRAEIDGRLPPDVQAIVKRATHPKPNMRYASAAEMASECEAAFRARAHRLDPTAIVANWAENRRALDGAHPTIEDASPRDEPTVAERSLRPTIGTEELAEIARLLALEPDDGGEIESGENSPTLLSPPGRRPIPDAMASSASSFASIGFGTSVSPNADPDVASGPDPTPPGGDAPLIGTLLHGYRVEEKIGGGISASVYRARHSVLEKECAVKVLVDRFAAEEAAQRRLRREAEMLSRIAHENILAVLDFGTTPDGKPFLMSELLHGRTLQRIIETEAPLDPIRTARIGSQLAFGLEAAHRAGLVHRDLKPANVMIIDGPRGELVKILDFGMVRILPAKGPVTKITTTGFLLGTPAYSSPEQILNPSAADSASDVYSLGVILYEMLSGKRPFTGPVYNVLSSHLNDAPPPLADLGGLEALAHALLDKAPERRPSAVEVRRELEAHVSSPTQAVSRPETIPSAPSRRSRASWIMMIAGGVLLGAVGATGVSYFTHESAMHALELEAPSEAPQIVPRAIGAGSEGPSSVDWESEDPSARDAPPAAPKPRVGHGGRPRTKYAPSSKETAAEEAQEPTPSLVLDKLKSIAAMLRSSRLPADELEAFENRYFSLRSEARPPFDGARAKDLAPRVLELESDLRRRLAE